MDFSNCFYDEQKKIWSSPGVPSIYNLECSIGRILHNQMKSFPNEICQVSSVAPKWYWVNFKNAHTTYT